MHALLLLTLTIAQPVVPGPPVVPGTTLPPTVPSAVPAAAPSAVTPYDKTRALAIKQKKPLVIFVGIPPFEVPGAVVMSVATFNGDDAWRMIVVPVGKNNGYTMNIDSSMASIRERAGLEVKPAASFFEAPSRAKTAKPDPQQAPPVGGNDDGPWLPTAEQKRLRKALKDLGVPVTGTLKFYKCDPVYQKMYTMNNGRSKFNDITPSNDIDPWRVSGGMHHIDKSKWRNVTGLDLPGKISYWQEDTDVRAFSLVPKWRWKFPTGTLAYDVLIRRENGEDKNIFEVRVHEKLETNWDDGTVYRPKVKIGADGREEYTWSFEDAGVTAQSVAYTVASISPKLPFVPSRSLAVSSDFTPPRYVGAGTACNNCHSKVGQLLDVPGHIYREAQRGDDGRFSWHPFSASGGIDTRWPIVSR